MEPPGPAKRLCPWRPCLVVLLLQLLLSVCFFSYVRVSRGDLTGFLPLGPSAVESAQAAPSRSPELPPQTTPATLTRRPLQILLWTWPFHIPLTLSPCSELVPGLADCDITANRKVYRQADAVIVHHWDVMFNPRSQLPPSPRPPGQRWVWYNMEPPLNSRQLRAMDGLFNLTMSYRSDSDVFMPYGWLEPWSGRPAHAPLNLSAKTELVAWAVSNWYLQELGRDPERYLSYFRWRERLRPRSFSWNLAFCKACWKLQQESRYQTVRSIEAWFT
ncbi:galactoside 3(4)-L-fucosyltransferase [Carlito syrichta]|uniref:Fucosyltransferase n=1 Tax=Carlito syrichta TaxID=1868482 RepID=A0A3Q0E3Y8_CARSF|nr:galactoside 3(4)-L-fucosyltransferase [Carlito syrichta]